MKPDRRPLSVTIIGCIYILMGAIGFVYHFTEFRAPHPVQYQVFWIELIRLIAILCGAYLLRGHNWARWLALAWIAYHVVLSAFHQWPQFVVHCLFCALIGWFLFRPAAGRYFAIRRNNQRI